MKASRLLRRAQVRPMAFVRPMATVRALGTVRAPVALGLGALLVLPCAIGYGARSGAGEPELRPAQRLTILEPKAGQRIEGHFSLVGRIDGALQGCFIVRVEAFGVTHHLAIEGGQAGGPQFRDPHLPVRPGEHEIRISGWMEVAPGRPLVEETLRVTVADPGPPSEAKVDLCRNLHSEDLPDLERRHAALLYRSGRDPAVRPALEAAADDLALARVHDVLTRVNNYGYLALAYAQALDLDRAIGCVQVAEAMLARDEPALARHPLGRRIDWMSLPFSMSPTVLETASNLHARLNDLETAVAYRQKVLEFLDRRIAVVTDANFRRNCMQHKVTVAREMGDLHLLLAGNRVAQKEWRTRAEQFLAQARQ